MTSAKPMDTATVLRVEDVDVIRDGNHLLRSISLTVYRQEHWAVLGANGAGKSTLLSLLGAHTHPSRGTVEVLGRRLGRVDLRELRSSIGHVNPRHTIQSRLRVRDVVFTGLTNTPELVPRWSPSAEEVHRADRLVDMLGMRPKMDATWTTLSQGERGRTLIARALMPLPRLLLLDEPATGLDVAAREKLLSSLDVLREDYPHLATVLVTHHLEELPTSTTHALLLRDGETVGQGLAEEVLTTDQVSKCFDHPVEISRTAGRWSARADRAPGINRT